MYRVGLIINENEASHSKYADTEATLKASIEACNENGRKSNSYDFVVYDKFTINKLFDTGDCDIETLNALFIATNALSFSEKIHTVLCNNKARIEAFINAHGGIFVSSQKKLSNGVLSTQNPRGAEFLPETYEYYLFDRPERHSAEGIIRPATASVLLEYPYVISSELIEQRCNINKFMAHKYRSVVFPKHPNSYETLLCDQDSPYISQSALGSSNSARRVLLYSRGSHRIVVSTMALDWANHAELLCNILTFITEYQPRIFFVIKGTEGGKSTIVDSYMIRANIANIPYREITERELHTCARSAGNSFLFSPNWKAEEVEMIYETMLKSQGSHFTIHHISNTNIVSDKNHKLSKYKNYSSIDVMKEAVVQSLLWSYHATKWGKSIWTISYVAKLFEMYSILEPNIAKRVYQELWLHFTKAEAGTDDRILSGDYDGVFNATCKMLEVLNIYARTYGDSIDQSLPCKLNAVIPAAEEWVLSKFCEGAVFDQDICYYLLYLTRFDKFSLLDKSIQTALVSAFEQLLATIAEEILSGKFVGRSSVDLCRVYQTLCVLTVNRLVATDKSLPYLRQIELTLRDRQDPRGNWKHISETAEITLMLLEAHADRFTIDQNMNIVNTIITKGIEVLQSQYSPDDSIWAEDVGATAKAMNAIGLYDKIFNYSINDFFSDLKPHRENVAGISDDITKNRIGYFYKVIDTLEKDKSSLAQSVEEADNMVESLRKKLSRVRYAVASSLAMLVGTASMLALLVFILYVDHKAILKEVASDWRSVLTGTIVGLIITAIIAEAFRLLRKRFGD